jgi:hypothetical protein
MYRYTAGASSSYQGADPAQNWANEFADVSEEWAQEFEVGLIQVESSWTHSLKAPGFNP